VLLMFYKTLKELRIVEIPVKDRVFKKFVTIKPQMGIVYEPAGEIPKEAKRLADADGKQINEEMGEYVRKVRGLPKHPSPIKNMEKQEDEQDFKEYKKKLR
jgi:hypothetical protein